jgi:hypothetical protein
MKESSLIKSIRKVIKETDSSSSAGAFNVPFRTGLRLWDKKTIAPYTEPLDGYNNAELYVDALDGNIDTKNVKNVENKSLKSSKFYKNHPSDNDDDGNNLNDNPFNEKLIKKIFGKKKIKEATDTNISSGEYNGPLEIGLKKWRSQELGPFVVDSNHYITKKDKKKNIKNNIRKKVGMWEKHKDSGYEIPTHDVHTIKEDLGVWFGTKKKPKGSKQPKGPWVNICKKVDGKHPPCGRPEASDKSYPKCRATGVASKMTDSQKKSACQQKRNAEKTHSKTGTGNKPKMVSYKPRKKTNESVLIKQIIKSLK